jgi:hypothetical protein
MKKILTVIVIGLLWFSTFPMFAAHVKAEGTVTDFESGFGGWQPFTQYGGVAQLSTTYAHSGTHSVEQSGDSSGSDPYSSVGRIRFPVASILDEYELSTWVYVTERSDANAGSFFGFVFNWPEGTPPELREVVGWGPWGSGSSYAQVRQSEGYMPKGDWYNPVPYGLSLNTWHQVKVIVYTNLGTVSIWLDGSLIVDSWPAFNAGEKPDYYDIECSANYYGTYVMHQYVDDVYPFKTWETAFVVPSGHPVVDFAVYNGSLYAAADNRLYVENGSSWNIVDAPAFVTSLETAKVAYQAPPTEWNRTYGDALYSEEANAVIQTSDGGYLLVGKKSVGMWWAKVDKFGNQQWNQTYGGSSNDVAYSGVQTADGGYAIGGTTYDSDHDFWLGKTSASGTMQWNKTYSRDRVQEAYSMIQTSDGGYALAGYSQEADQDNDFWLVKTDSNGAELWNQTYDDGVPNNQVAEEGWAVVQTDEGGYAVLGVIHGWVSSDYDFWLVKTDSNGVELWNQTYGLDHGGHDIARSIVQTNDGGFALAGSTEYNTAGGRDFLLIKTYANGTLQWNHTYGGVDDDEAKSLIQTADGGYALAGYTNSFGAINSDVWMVKTDSFGNIQWNKKYGDIGQEKASSVMQTSDGGYAIAGFKTNGTDPADFWLIKNGIEPYTEKLVIGGKGGLYSYDGISFDLVFSMPTYIRVLGVWNNRLYAGTMLDRAPKLYYCNGLADNPSDWHVDTGFSTVLGFSGAFGSIDSFAVYDNVMYVGSGGKLYSFDGTDWSIAASYDDVSAFLAMKVYDGKLYLATRDEGWRKPLYQGGTGFSGRVIEYDGASWTTVLDHDYWVYSLGVYDGKLYVGTANKIFTHNGTSWETSFNATEGAYYALCFENYDGKIYVGMGNGYIFVDPAPPKVNLEVAAMPEFPSATILTVFMALGVLTTALIKKKRTRRLS